MTDRLEKLRAALRDQGLDALAVVPGANMRYLTGLAFTTKLRLTAAYVDVFDGRPKANIASRPARMVRPV